MNRESSPMARSVIIAAAFVVVVAGLKAAETLLVPFLLSVFIALIFSPLLAWLKRLRVPNGLAICLIIALVILAGWLIGILVGASINDFRQNLPQYQERLQQMSGGLLTWLSERGLSLDMEQMRQSFDPGKVMQLAGNTLSSLGNVMTNAFMILLTVVFILAEEVGFSDKLQSARQDNGATREALERFIQSVNSYLGIKSLLSLLTGALVMIWLWILGVDYPVMWGLLAFLLNFVPTIGSIIAAVPPVLLALIQLGPLVAGLTALGYLVVNVVVGNVLEPKVMGRGLNLSPLVVFLSLVFWGWVLGPVGMLLSIPLTIMVKIALENHPDTYWLGVMLGAGVTRQALSDDNPSGDVPVEAE
ncbi:MAG: AI-2E family transporter [Gammaproteobacteria bacterium]|nr:MAG: AI-2E family transporter [Gammaproteobacteria bacterium]